MQSAIEIFEPLPGDNLKNTIHVSIEFDEYSDYMNTRKNGVLWLKKAFAKTLAPYAVGEVKVRENVFAQYDIFDLDADARLSISMTAKLDEKTFKLFKDDYSEFMSKVYGNVSLSEYGVKELVVFDNYEAERLAAEKAQENILDYY